MQSWLDLFVAAPGEDEIPKNYYRWAGISTLAAVLENRVWMEWLPGSKIYPNLYVMLIGPSGSGKNVAIDRAYSLVGSLDPFNVYRGRATIQFLIDYLDQSQNQTALYLLMPELSAEIGTGGRADDFIRLVTELYSGSDYYFQEGTRTHGGKVLKAPCLNWLAGTTREWLVSSIPLESIKGGFFARVIPVEGQYDYSIRIWRPAVPLDYDHIMAKLSLGIDRARNLQGPLVLSPGAEVIGEQWYMGRPEPDTLLEPSWHRQRVMMFKLAMILSVAEHILTEKPFAYEITRSAMIEAQKLLDSVARGLPNLLNFAATNQETRGIQVAMEMIKERRKVTRSQLLKKLYHHGINTRRFQAEVLPTLLTHPRIRKEDRDRTQWFYYQPLRIIHVEETG